MMCEPRSAGLCPSCGSCDTLVVNEVRGIRVVRRIRGSIAGMFGTIYLHLCVDERAIGCRGCGRSSRIVL
jgi:hypothetical protein